MASPVIPMGLEGIPLGITEVGAPGLLILVVALVLLGLYRRKLVPEKDLLDERKEKEDWKAAYEIEHQARRESDKQVGELAGAVDKSNQIGEMSLAILRALRDKADLTDRTDAQ